MQNFAIYKKENNAEHSKPRQAITINCFTTMKKIIAKLFGVYAGVKNINGRKSSGVEDSGGFKHWAYYRPNGFDDFN